MIKNITGTTVDLLGAAILGGRYPVGEVIPNEVSLCSELGVSRTVVREAVKVLAAKGLIATSQKTGSRVLPSADWNWFDPEVILWQSRIGLTPEFLRDLQDLRIALEPVAIRLAAQRANAADIAQIEAAYEGMRLAIEEGGDYMSNDLLFHQRLLHASKNRMLMQMNKVLSALLRTSFELSTKVKDGPRDSLPLHRAVLNAVIAKDAAKAESAMLVLIEGANSDIEVVLKSKRKLPSLDVPARHLRSA